MTAKTWQEDLAWYEKNQTTSQIGFNPDGMCLKIVRTSRGISSLYPSAKIAQDATPREHRFYKASDLRKGMKVFFDEPNDSNIFGHVATMVGRLRGYDPNDQDGILYETNSVKRGELVVVRGSYFERYWGDAFQFGTDWLNGVEFDYAGKNKKEKPKKDTSPRVENFRQSGNLWDVKILDRAVKNGRRDIEPKVKAIEDAVDGLPDDIKDTRVKKFKKTFAEERVLQMALLNQAVTDGRLKRVKEQRDKLRVIIKSVLRH